MKAKQHPEIKPLGLGWSIIVCAVVMAALFFTTTIALPWIAGKYGVAPNVAWYIGSSLLVFLPMLVAALLLVRLEQKNFTWKSFLSRIRHKTLKSEDWLWIGIGIVLSIILTGLFASLSKVLIPSLPDQPAFMKIPTLNEDNMWILLLWAPMIVLNILGEEVFWRGYIFPRQARGFGKYTWFYNGIIWLLCYIPMGISLMIIMIPSFFLTTWAFQKTSNIKVPLTIHGFISGVGFLAIAFGYI